MDRHKGTNQQELAPNTFLLLPVSFLCAALLYALTRSPHPGWGDGMGFLLAASRGFDLNTNATSHFLYNNLNHLALLLFPVRNQVSVLVWLNIAYALGALWQTYHLALLVSRHAFAAALMTLALATGYTFWRQAVGIEVYACYLLMVSALLRYAVADLVRVYPYPQPPSPKKGGFLRLKALFRRKFAAKGPERGIHDGTPSSGKGLGVGVEQAAVPIRTRRGVGVKHAQHTLLLSLLWGLAVLVHIQAVLLLPALAVWAWYVRPKTGQVLMALAIAGGMFSVLFLLPLLLHTHDLASVFAEKQFRQHLSGLDIALLFKGLALSVAFLLYQFHVWLWPVLRGGKALWHTARPVAVFLAAVLVPFWGFASRYGVTDAYVFFLVPYLALVPVGAAGLAALLGQRPFFPVRKYAALALVPLLAWGGYHLAAKAATASGKAGDFQAQKAYKGGLAYYLYPGMEAVPDPLPLIRAGVPNPDTLEWAHVYRFGRAYVGRK